MVSRASGAFHSFGILFHSLTLKVHAEERITDLSIRSMSDARHLHNKQLWIRLVCVCLCLRPVDCDVSCKKRQHHAHDNSYTQVSSAFTWKCREEEKDGEIKWKAKQMIRLKSSKKKVLITRVYTCTVLAFSRGDEVHFHLFSFSHSLRPYQLSIQCPVLVCTWVAILHRHERACVWLSVSARERWGNSLPCLQTSNIIVQERRWRDALERNERKYSESASASETLHSSLDHLLSLISYLSGLLVSSNIFVYAYVHALL